MKPWVLIPVLTGAACHDVALWYQSIDVTMNSPPSPPALSGGLRVHAGPLRGGEE